MLPPPSRLPPPFVQGASDKAIGHIVTAWYTLQELEQDTDTIHDLLSLAGTSLPSLTGSKQQNNQNIHCSSLGATMPNLWSTRNIGCHSDQEQTIPGTIDDYQQS